MSDILEKNDINPKEIVLMCILDMLDDFPDDAHIINNANYVLMTSDKEQNFKLTKKTKQKIREAFSTEYELLKAKWAETRNERTKCHENNKKMEQITL